MTNFAGRGIHNYVAISIEAQTYEGAAKNLRIDRFPDSCPICHHAIEPVARGPAHVNSDGESKLEIVFRCPRRFCQRLFISRYIMGGLGIFQFSESVPFEPVNRAFSEHITDISPDFCEIYNEALNAERQRWLLVAGPGYRKALEFLVKDYLIGRKPDDAAQIENEQLGACIAKYVDNEMVKTTASRAAWIGNDETHYARKWVDKDLQDLKTLINLTEHWIEMEEMTKNSAQQMPAGKK